MNSLEGQLCFALYSTSLAVGRAYAPLLVRLGITYPQYIVMLVLWERDDISVKSIGDRLFLDSGTLTPLLKRLAALDLVKRTRDRDDERQVLISLTASGRAMRERASHLPNEIACAMGKPLDEVIALRDELLRLRAILMHGAGGERSPSRRLSPGFSESDSIDRVESASTRRRKTGATPSKEYDDVG